MTIQECIERIDRYLTKRDGLPLLVDVQNYHDLSEIKTHYRTRANIILSASEFCKADELPQIDNFLDRLGKDCGNLFVTGLATFLKIKGQTELQNTLNDILSTSIAGRVVLITYKCKDYFKISDPRISRRVLVIEENCNGHLNKPQILLTAPNLLNQDGIKIIKGIHKLAEELEKDNGQQLYVETSKTKDDFPNSLFVLTNLRTEYDALRELDTTTAQLSEATGTKTQWKFALSKVRKYGSWQNAVNSMFGNSASLEIAFPNYASTTDDNLKWMYFVALKLYGAKNNFCLKIASKNASSHEEFVKQIFYSLLPFDHQASNFSDFYKQRKNLLSQLKNIEDEAIYFCRLVRQKGKESIYYLTDCTNNEQELLFELLDRYGTDYDYDELIKLLNFISPKIYQYMQPYNFGDVGGVLLNDYFQVYKYQKIINKVLPEFESLVTEQAYKKDYNRLLSPRSSLVEALDRTDAQLYFVDAMGVEYLSYIVSKCNELNLYAKIQVCSCNLPSITSKNKEFIELFNDCEHQTVLISDLDDTKHGKNIKYDYQQTKLPIHLLEELKIIDKFMLQISNKLKKNAIKKAVVISDHGASRLAVIHETENFWTMSSPGIHSGRCCPIFDAQDNCPNCATEADGFWVLANYDRFKGGRKANVEVHGGATLEEVTVPIIEITLKAQNINVCILPTDAQVIAITPQTKTPIIEISYKIKAQIKIFATQKLSNISIRINGKDYNATKYADPYYYFEMSDIKKEGTYKVDVLTDGNIIASELPLIIKKKGLNVRDLL